MMIILYAELHLGNIEVTAIEILSSNNAIYEKWIVRVRNKSMKTDNQNHADNVT